MKSTADIFSSSIYQLYHFVRKISLNSIWWWFQHRHLGAAKELKKLKGLMYRLSRLERNAPCLIFQSSIHPRLVSRNFWKSVAQHNGTFTKVQPPLQLVFIASLCWPNFTCLTLWSSSSWHFTCLTSSTYILTAVDSDTFSLRYILFNYNQIMYVNWTLKSFLTYHIFNVLLEFSMYITSSFAFIFVFVVLSGPAGLI